MLNLVELPDPEPTAGQLLIEVDRAGVNYADTHHAENSYLAKTTPPLVPGGEVVGRMADGRRVAALVGSGGYAERAVARPAEPWRAGGHRRRDRSPCGVARARPRVLLRRSVHLEPGESVVVHVAAGGVGTWPSSSRRRGGPGGSSPPRAAPRSANWHSTSVRMWPSTPTPRT